MEYGPHEDHYAVHVIPTHPQRNLSNENMVKAALKELVVILNEYVPTSLQVDLFLPRDDWKMKVLTAKVRDGLKAWNFDVKKLEEEGVPRIFEAVEKVILP